MSENELKKACFDYLQLLENKGLLIYIRNNSFSGAIQRSNGVEFKTPKGIQSPDQKEWEKKITKLGHNYYIIKDPEDLTKIIAYYRV